ncbi:FtsX-like permease family protein [Streptomyces aidingensis]|uniref:FtsX-like permease family protein n=1 Tax=Streptomyces aidingensis TaxID=910347 RepID=A0A1I1EPK1_9ACTN|nr:FtsX-like permease family protein [Streptomyces aidingensis]SFB89021.1 FtsX-like permease family protein [Streptomyces aidingensis]
MTATAAGPAAATASAASAGPRRWAADLALGARFAVTGGREGWLRTVLTAVGVGLGVAVLLLAASIPNLLTARDARLDARTGGFGAGVEPGSQTLLLHQQTGDFLGRPLTGLTLRPDGDRPPMPPGIEEFPAPGEMALSPALRKLLESPDGELLAPRLPYRAGGEIGDAGLLHPGELVYYAHDPELRSAGSTWRVAEFGHDAPRTPFDAVLLLLIVVACVVLLLPVGAFVATAVRLGGERRDLRLAALRLVGADIRMTHRIAAGEALAGALLGLLLGAVFFRLGRDRLAGVEIFGYSAFPQDVRPSAAIAVLIVALVPVSAVAVTLQAMRRIAVEPLGVVRGGVTARRRLWWRLLLPAAGLALLAPLFNSVAAEQTEIDEWRVAAGIVLLLVGVTAVLPWLVEAAVRRLRGGPVPWQLAVRRLQLDSGPAARAVSGVTVAVAGAIAAQMFLLGVGGDYTSDTGVPEGERRIRFEAYPAEPADAPATAARIAAVAGVVQSEVVVRDGARAADGPAGEGGFEVLIADCAVLGDLMSVPRAVPCADGDVFLQEPAPGTVPEDRPSGPLRPGLDIELAGDGHTSPEAAAELPAVRWRIPADARVLPAAQGDELWRPTVFATPAALDRTMLYDPLYEVTVRADGSGPDVMQRLRNAAAGFGPVHNAWEQGPEQVSNRFDSIRRALCAGAVAVLMLIGGSMVVGTVEQLRERRRLLSVLVAFGTRRRTLALSVLWQTALPVVLGLALAAAGGIGLGWVLLGMVSAPVAVDWQGVGAFTALGGGVILGATALAMPPLWRMMRPAGLRTE